MTQEEVLNRILDRIKEYKGQVHVAEDGRLVIRIHRSLRGLFPEVVRDEFDNVDPNSPDYDLYWTVNYAMDDSNARLAELAVQIQKARELRAQYLAALDLKETS